MATSEFFKLGTVNRKKTTLLTAIKHNSRELQNERGGGQNIDPSRSKFNYALHGTGDAKAINRHANVLMAGAGIDKLRKNAALAVEVLFSLPNDRHQQDTKPFFVDCYNWTLKSFAGELLSFHVHLDEGAPHAHALILPLIDGKMRGNEGVLGDREKVKRIRDSYFADVGAKHGLSKRDYKQFTKADKANLSKEVLRCLSNDSVQKSAIFAWVRDSIIANPMPCAELLGVTFTPVQKQTKHFVDIKRSHGKGSFEK